MMAASDAARYVRREVHMPTDDELERLVNARLEIEPIDSEIGPTGGADDANAPPHTAAPISASVSDGRAKSAQRELKANLRRPLRAELSEFLADEKFCHATTDAAMWLIVQLSRYQEEGVLLYPRVLICDDLSKLLPRLLGRDAKRLGEGERTTATMKLALKTCAPLARDQWIAYVQRTAFGEKEGFAYGVFREETTLAGDVRDKITSGEVLTEASGSAVLVSQVAERVVELVGGRGKTLTFHLTGVPDDQESPREAIDALAQAITADVDPADRASTASFLSATLGDALRRGHGTLIAVAAPSAIPSELLEDGVPLVTAPIDVADCIHSYLVDGTKEALARALAHATLIEGVLGTDGITVFEANARITQYNVFVSSGAANSGPGKKPLTPRELAGGARRRAFEALKRLVDQGKLKAAFFRSADGASELYPRGKK